MLGWAVLQLKMVEPNINGHRVVTLDVDITLGVDLVLASLVVLHYPIHLIEHSHTR